MPSALLRASSRGAAQLLKKPEKPIAAATNTIRQHRDDADRSHLRGAVNRRIRNIRRFVVWAAIVRCQ